MTRHSTAVLLTSSLSILFLCGELRSESLPVRGEVAAEALQPAPANLQVVAVTGSREIRLGGWVTYWDFASGLDVARRRAAVVKDVFFFAAHLTPAADPALTQQDLGYAAATAAVRSSSGIPWLTVVNDVRPDTGEPMILKDPGVVHRMLSDSEARRRHIQQVTRMAVSLGFSGVDIDYENLLVEDRDLFSLFTRELATALKEKGLLLSVTVQPKVRESRSPGPGAADWTALCRSVDRLQVMLYNLHNRQTDPGPLATSSWIQEVLHFAATQGDLSRIIPVIKTSGMVWGPDAAKDLTYTEAVDLAARCRAPVLRQENDSTPHFSCRLETGEYTVFFEDAVSLREKVAVAAGLGFSGAVLWSLGKEDPAFWPVPAD